MSTQDCGGVGDDELFNKAEGDDGKAQLEDFFFDHRGDGPGGLARDIVSADKVFNDSGFIPSVAGVRGKLVDENIGVFEAVYVERNNLCPGAFEFSFEMMVRESDGGVVVFGGGEDGLDYGEYFTGAYPARA